MLFDRLYDTCLVVATDSERQPLHVRIIQSAWQNYSLCTGKTFPISRILNSVFLDRKLSLVVALLWEI